MVVQVITSQFFPTKHFLECRIRVLTTSLSIQNSILSQFSWTLICWKIMISSEPNIRWTSDLFVNSSLSVEKDRLLYLSHFNSCSMTKIKKTFFQIACDWDFQQFLMIFHKIPYFSKSSQKKSLKARGLICWILAI